MTVQGPREAASETDAVISTEILSFNGIGRANGLTVAFPLELHVTPSGLHLRLARQPLLQHLVLGEDVQPGDTGKGGNVLDYLASSSQFVDTTLDVSLEDQTVDTVTDPKDAGLYLEGERHVCLFDANNAKYLPLSGPGPHLGKVDETSGIARGNSGTIDVWHVNAGSAAATSLEVEAYNWHNTRLWSGTPVWIELHQQSRRWYVTKAHAATLLLAAVNEPGGVATTDTTFSVDSITPLNGHFGSATISAAQNTFAHEFDDNAVVGLVWNDDEDRWETWQGTCPS